MITIETPSRMGAAPSPMSQTTPQSSSVNSSGGQRRKTGRGQ